MTHTTVANTYRHMRKAGQSPAGAIALARRMDEQGKGKDYAPPRPSVYNPPFTRHGYTALRWIESTDAAGLRFVGYADELIERLGQRGWFADTFEDEVYRGAVWQIPARNGQSCFVYGYADPCNDGAALVCFDIEQNPQCAARQSDRLAEKMAEESRNYSEAWQQAREWDELAETMKELRDKARELVTASAGMRNAGLTSPIIRTALRERLAAYVSDWEAARTEREELAGNFYHWQDGKRIDIASFAAREF